MSASPPTSTAASISKVAGRVCCLLSTLGNDPTEVVVPVQLLQKAGFVVDFATEDGMPAACDPRMVGGWVGALLVSFLASSPWPAENAN